MRWRARRWTLPVWVSLRDNKKKSVNRTDLDNHQFLFYNKKLDFAYFDILFCVKHKGDTNEIYLSADFSWMLPRYFRQIPPGQRSRKGGWSVCSKCAYRMRNRSRLNFASRLNIDLAKRFRFEICKSCSARDNWHQPVSLARAYRSRTNDHTACCDSIRNCILSD